MRARLHHIEHLVLWHLVIVRLLIERRSAVLIRRRAISRLAAAIFGSSLLPLLSAGIAAACTNGNGFPH